MAVANDHSRRQRVMRDLPVPLDREAWIGERHLGGPGKQGLSGSVLGCGSWSDEFASAMQRAECEASDQ
jgi:hypothetical protein